jgi:hypothetical protein
MGGDGRAENGMAVGDGQKGTDDLVGFGAFKQVASCACPHGGKDLLVVFVHGQ